MASDLQEVHQGRWASETVPVSCYDIHVGVFVCYIEDFWLALLRSLCLTHSARIARCWTEGNKSSLLSHIGIRIFCMLPVKCSCSYVFVYDDGTLYHLPACLQPCHMEIHMGNSNTACSRKKSLGRQPSYLAPATMKPARIVRCLFVGFTMHTHTHFLHILYYNLEGTLHIPN